MPRTATAERPRADKHRAITVAAAETFLAEGYEGTNLDHIAARAGVSKQTIYNHFGGKEALFRAICAELNEELTAPLQPTCPSRDLRTVLISLGESCLEVSLRPSSLDLHRLIISATARFPELGREVYAAGPARLVDDLAALIERHARTGELQVKDARAAAEQFFGMLTGFDHLRALLGVEVPDEAARRERVIRAVDAFLAALGHRAR